MHTDNTAKSGKEMIRLTDTSEKAGEIQKQLLTDLLCQNRKTKYGRKCRFSRIKSVEDFQRKVPVSDYNDYEKYLIRIVNGEKNILTAEDVVYFCISSRAADEEFYLPLTETDIYLQYLYAYEAVSDAVREHCQSPDGEKVFGRIFQTESFMAASMPDGRLKGIRSGCLFRWLSNKDELDLSNYCIPKEVFLPDTSEDLLYVRVRFALAEPNITGLHGVLINRMAGVMDYIYQNWDLLLKDIEHGTIDESIALSERWRNYLKRKLPADADRAKELGEITKNKLQYGMVKKIWKNAKYILAVGGEAFSCYTERMRRYAEDVPIHHFVYAASAGIFGIAEKVDVSDRYILIPEAGFFEFIPVNDADRVRTLLMQDVRVGEKYELVFTNHSGFYRYRTGDVIEVVDWHHRAPVVKYCYRKDQVIDLAGEKSNQQQLNAAIANFAKEADVTIKGYCVQKDDSGTRPRYLFYIECMRNKMNSRAEKILEECMRQANAAYRSCAERKIIAPLKIAFLMRGSFMRYEQKLAAEGRHMGQNMPVHVLDTEDKKTFFASQRIGKS